MSFVVQVKIEGVGTGDDSNIGMVAGDLLWCSAGATYGTSGIIDESSVQGLSNAIAIAQGGNLGGPQGEISIVATSLNVMQAILTDDIVVTGKNMTVSVSVDGGSLVTRYTGTVSSWAGIDEIRIAIKSLASSQLDTTQIPSASLTKQSALVVDGSTAEGKNVTEPFGRLIDYPLILTPQAKDYRSFAVRPGLNLPTSGGDFYSSYADNPLGIWQTETTSGEEKGISLLHVMGVEQESENENIWVLVAGGKGYPFFTATTDQAVNQIRQALVGSFIECQRGLGAGERWAVLDVAFKTFPTYLQWVWIQIAEKDVEAVRKTQYVAEDFWPGTSVVRTRWLTMQRVNDEIAYPSSNGADLTWSEQWRAHYYGGNGIMDDVSYISIATPNDVYIVSSSSELDGAELYGLSPSGSEVFIPLAEDSITVLYQNEVWKMIRVSVPSASFIETDDRLSLVDYKEIETRLYSNYDEPSVPSEPVNNLAYGLSWEKDDITNMQIIPSGGLSHNKTFSTAYLVSGGSTFNYIPLEDLWDGTDLSQDGGLFVMPNIEHHLVPDATTGAGTPTIRLTVDLYVFGESNTVLGTRQTDITIEYGSIPSGHDWFIHIDPETRSIKTSSLVSGYGEDSRPLFDLFKAGLDVTEFLKAGSIYQVRGFGVRTRVLYKTYGYSSSTYMNKIVKPMSAGFTQNISKEKLFLRTTKAGKSLTVTPASLALQVITDAGIDWDTDSWDSTIIRQTELMDDYLSFSGQAHPSPGTSVADLVANISKSSMTAVWQGPDSKLYAKWFGDDNAETAVVQTFTGNEILKGSFNISKPNGGYRYTDYDFQIIQTMISEIEYARINSGDGISEFPGEDDFVLDSNILQAPDWEFTKYDQVLGDFLRFSATDVTDGSQSLLFVPGTRWVIGDGSNAVTGTLRVVAPNYEAETGQGGFALAFDLDDTTVALGTPSSMFLFGPDPKWRNLVSGSFITDYLVGKNIWEHAQEARASLNRELPMPTDTTVLKYPVWGNDKRGLMQWMLYTVLHGSKSKTVIRFEARMDADTIQRRLMDFVKVQFGVYGINPTYGWIVETTDNLERGTVSFTILTALSDADIFILDETDGAFEMTVDETTGVSEVTFDEGGLV